MTNKKTRHALVSSIISLVLCCSMLIGTTFAWFTDSVTSTGNIIKSGTLDVEMSWSNTKDGTYKDASEGAIFNYKFWEPGYVDIKYIKLENVGDLAFKYQLTVQPTISNTDGNKLAEVIDVYAAIVEDSFSVDRTNFADRMTNLGTLNTLVGTNLADDGVLLPKEGNTQHIDKATITDEYYEEAVTVCLALKMKEEAGNEYQNLTIGEGFAVQLLATQYTYEKDSFDHTYDGTADNTPSSTLPLANVTLAPELVDNAELDWNPTYGTVHNGDGVTLDAAYIFVAPDDYATALERSYATWHADFVVSFDRDVTAADGAGIAGNYGAWKWIGFTADADSIDILEGLNLAENDTIKAGTEIRLLSLYGDTMTINYAELCLLVQEFACGAWADSNLEPLTINVQLRLYEAPSEGTTGLVSVETGKYDVIGNYSHTFGVA